MDRFGGGGIITILTGGNGNVFEMISDKNIEILLEGDVYVSDIVVVVVVLGLLIVVVVVVSTDASLVRAQYVIKSLRRFYIRCHHESIFLQHQNQEHKSYLIGSLPINSYFLTSSREEEEEQEHQ